MPSLQKRNGFYSAVFAKRIDGKLRKRVFALKTKNKKVAEKKLYEYSQLYDAGEFDPFNETLPNLRAESKSVQKEVRLDKVSKIFLESRTQSNDVTKNDYRRHLKMLRDQMGETFPVTKLEQKDIHNFCFKSHLRPHTQKSYLTHIRQFCKWLRDEGYQSTDISAKVKPPKTTDNIHDKTITHEQLMQIHHEFRKDLIEKKRTRQITQPYQMQTWFRPATSMAFHQGLRVREIVELRWTDIDFKGDKILVRESKNKYGREVPLLPEMKDILLAWHRKNGRPKSGLVFPSTKPGMTEVKMSKENISRIFKRYCRAAKLPESVNFHGLRHSCGTRLHNLGMDVVDIGKFLGNGRGATEKYVHSSFSTLQKKLNEKIPHNRLNNI